MLRTFHVCVCVCAGVSTTQKVRKHVAIAEDRTHNYRIITVGTSWDHLAMDMTIDKNKDKNKHSRHNKTNQA